MLPILDGRPVLNEQVEEIAHRVLAAVDVVSNIVKDNTAPENAHAAEHQQRHRRARTACSVGVAAVPSRERRLRLALGDHLVEAFPGDAKAATKLLALGGARVAVLLLLIKNVALVPLARSRIGSVLVRGDAARLPDLDLELCGALAGE